MLWFKMSTENEQESSGGDQGRAENPASSSGYSSNLADLALDIAASLEAMDTLSTALAGSLAAALGAGQYRSWEGCRYFRKNLNHRLTGFTALGNGYTC